MIIKIFEKITEKLYVDLCYKLRRLIMDKNDDVYIVLKKLGFVDEEIQRLAVVNTKLNKMIDEDVIERIRYLTKKGLTIDEIKELTSKNSKVLTNDISYFEMMEEKYVELGFGKKELKQLLINFDRALTIEPVMIEVFKRTVERKGYTKEQIQDELINNPYKYFEDR